MSLQKTQIDTNESVLITTVRPTERDNYLATVHVTGTFGGGTVALQSSPDNGDTKVTLEDGSGNAIENTVNFVRSFQFGFAGRNGEEIQLYATMTGATSPDIIVHTHDNA